MNRHLWIHFTLVIIISFSILPPNLQAVAASYTVGYSLNLEEEDIPEVIIRVQGFPGNTASFAFLGEAFGRFSDLQSVFKNIEVKDSGGQSLPWQWGAKRIIVTNGSVQDFSIRYIIDSLNFREGPAGDPSAKLYTLFRFRRIYFIAGNVFPIPELEPDRITVDPYLPEGVSLFSSLPSEDGSFVATKDLWGNLAYDFQKAYFAGGHKFFSLIHTTEWGDEYEYIWFDRDPITEAWTPTYGNTPWEQAENYMDSAEACARYFREAIGPLPTHRVLFTNVLVQYEGFPSAGTNQDWFHYMQIWPRYSEPEICHHVFHQYSFFISQSKMPFGGDAIGQMLSEGLATYYEQVLPSLFYDDPRYAGKLFEFYAIDERGAPFGVRGNTAFHVRYNRSSLKVYLLDRYIRSVTDGTSSLDDFVQALWERVKDRTEPEQVSQADNLEAFASVVGAENTGYLTSLASQVRFDLADLTDLQAPFASYVDWMSQEFFWGKDLFFYVYLDITSAKGNEWPHFATYPHNIPNMRAEALRPFWDHLSSHAGSMLTEQDILDAMQAATGRDHAGFFEFWAALGVVLDPQEIADLSSWKPEERSVEDALPLVWESVGTLRTEHLLRGFPQNATIFLDSPITGNKIYIETQLFSDDGFVDQKVIVSILDGSNVTLHQTYTQMYENIYITGAVLQVTTEDPAGREYPIVLTYPEGEGIPRFAIDLASSGDQIGDLYYLGPLNPIALDLVNDNNELILPDTPLENETFLVYWGGEEVQFLPGESLSLSLEQGTAEVVLLDQFGFIRGLGSVDPINLDPVAAFSFDPTEPRTQTIVQFSDTSVDPDGDITGRQWSFGDGSTSEESTPVHSFSEAGSYTITLTVVDDQGGTSSHSETLVVVKDPLRDQRQLILPITGGVLLFVSLATIYLLRHRRKRKTG